MNKLKSELLGSKISREGRSVKVSVENIPVLRRLGMFEAFVDGDRMKSDKAAKIERMNTINNKSVSDMNVSELKDLAELKNIEGFKSMKKDELIEVLSGDPTN